MKVRWLGYAAILAAGVLAAPVKAAPLDCTMRFDLSSWSVIYKHASGSGVVTCDDGSRMNVKLRANGGGLSVGKSTIKDGKGNFTDIQSITDVLGTYAAADASIGVPKSGDAQVMTKGKVSLALAGAGKGFGMGVTIGGLTIEKVP